MNVSMLHVGRMQHVGRSGLPGGVRYSAHENGLNAEDFTQDVITHYAAWEIGKQQMGEIYAKLPLLLSLRGIFLTFGGFNPSYSLAEALDRLFQCWFNIVCTLSAYRTHR